MVEWTEQEHFEDEKTNVSCPKIDLSSLLISNNGSREESFGGFSLQSCTNKESIDGTTDVSHIYQQEVLASSTNMTTNVLNARLMQMHGDIMILKTWCFAIGAVLGIKKVYEVSDLAGCGKGWQKHPKSMEKTKTRTGWVGFGDGLAGLDTDSGRSILFFSGTSLVAGSAYNELEEITRMKNPVLEAKSCHVGFIFDNILKQMHAAIMPAYDKPLSLMENFTEESSGSSTTTIEKLNDISILPVVAVLHVTDKCCISSKPNTM
nr:hypothetical protein [Tanacetum cinerariifolium]